MNSIVNSIGEQWDIVAQGHPQEDPNVVFNFNMCYINHHCGRGAVIKCISHSNRDKFQGKYTVDTDGCVEVCKLLGEVPDINTNSCDSHSFVVENSQGVCCNEDIECGDVLDMYPTTLPQVNCPCGNSVNDEVNRFEFDSRPFTLRLPVIDDITEAICGSHLQDPVLFKNDIARVFKNLRAYPVDALKFGIK